MHRYISLFICCLVSCFDLAISVIMLGVKLFFDDGDVEIFS